MNFKQRAKARKRLWAGFPLSFEAGDTVIVTAKEEEAWWKGEVGGKSKAVLAALALFGFVFP